MLTFAAPAWLKLMFFLRAGDTEVGGFAVTSEHDPLYVTEFVTVRQRCTAVTVEFDDAAVADHFDRCVDAGLRPEQFARIWVHTHPGESPDPSHTDEETFGRVFGACDWAVMFVVGRTGLTYARLRFNAGPGGELTLGVAVDWSAWAAAMADDEGQWDARLSGWMDEYGEHVCPAELGLPLTPEEAGGRRPTSFDLYDWAVAEPPDASAGPPEGPVDPYFDPLLERVVDPWFDEDPLAAIAEGVT